MRRSNWYTLDNSAKLMPSMTNNLNTNVFRLTCALYEYVDESILQESLDEAVIEFPLFLYTMKNGIFWHYLDKSNIKPKVELLKTNPCARIDNGLLFRLSYYKKRINLEVYHVLADGNGAMEFLKFIVCTYLDKKHNINSSIPINESSSYEKSSDDFKKFDKSNYKIKMHKQSKAYKFKFQRKNDIIHDVIEAHLDMNSIKKEAKKYNTTLTIYLSALLIQTIIENARIKDLKKPIGITIPVDLRHTFPSKTSRNFFYTVCVQYKGDENSSIESIIDSLKKQFEDKLSKKNLQNMLNSYMIIQKFILIRLVPNFLKDWILNFISKLSKLGETIVFSNLGIIEMPEMYQVYIESFIPLMSTETMRLTSATYKNDLVLCFTSHFVNKEIERKYLKKLQQVMDKKIIINSNVIGELDE